MEFLDRLLGRPTLDALIKDVTAWLVANGFKRIQVDRDQRLIHAWRDGDAESTVTNLSSLHHEYRHAPRRARNAVVERFMSILLRVADASPASYEEARLRLMPVIRSAAAMANAQLGMQQSSKSAQSQDLRLQYRPLVADIAAALVIDMPTAMAFVTDRDLSRWGISVEQAFEDALNNLRGLPEQGGWRELSPGLWRGAWGDSYESSRLLLPDLIHRLGISSPVVMAPFRDVLLVTSAANEAAIRDLLDLTESSLANNNRWLSFKLLALQGTAWHEYTPSEAAQEQVHRLDLHSMADIYASQKQVLDAGFKEQGVDIFVASYKIAQRPDSSLTSFAVWAEGVDSLLPVAETVYFGHTDGGDKKMTMVPWATVREQFSALMEATEHVPTRFRVRQFPGREALAAASGGLGDS